MILVTPYIAIINIMYMYLLQKYSFVKVTFLKIRKIFTLKIFLMSKFLYFIIATGHTVVLHYTTSREYAKY